MSDNIKLDLTELCLNDLNRVDLTALEKDNILDDNLVDSLLEMQPSYSFLKKEYNEDYNSVIKEFPMYHTLSINSLKDKILDNYIKRLPETDFSAHISVKIEGTIVRLVYKEGNLIKIFDRYDKELSDAFILDNFNEIDDINGLDYAEIRGIITESNFIAYDFVGDCVEFDTKSELYDYLEELGFEIPLYWVVDDLNKETLRDELRGIVSDCELELTADDNNNISGYQYVTSGLLFTLNDYEASKEMGTFDNVYDLSSLVIKDNLFKKETYKGIIQTILWKQEVDCLRPYALIAEDVDAIKSSNFVYSVSDIEELENLGVFVNDNMVIEVPLYDASNMIKLDAYVGNELNFVFGMNNNIIPCYDDGTLVSIRKGI